MLRTNFFSFVVKIPKIHGEIHPPFSHRSENGSCQNQTKGVKQKVLSKNYKNLNTPI